MLKSLSPGDHEYSPGPTVSTYTSHKHLVEGSKCQSRLRWLSWRGLTLIKTLDFLLTIVVSLIRGIPFLFLSLFQDKALSPRWHRHHYHVLEFLNVHHHLLSPRIIDICDHSLCLSHSSKPNCLHLCAKRTIAHVSTPQGAQGPTVPLFSFPTDTLRISKVNSATYMTTRWWARSVCCSQSLLSKLPKC